MSEILKNTQESAELRISGANYYRNKSFIAVQRAIDRQSQLDLLPIYSHICRHGAAFESAEKIHGKHIHANVDLLRFYPNDDTSTVVESIKTDTELLLGEDPHSPFTSPVECQVVAARAHVLQPREGKGTRMRLALVLDDNSFISREREVFEHVLSINNVAYRHHRAGKKLDLRPELYLATFESADGFKDSNIDQFLDTLHGVAPESVMLTPLAQDTATL